MASNHGDVNQLKYAVNMSIMQTEKQGFTFIVLNFRFLVEKDQILVAIDFEKLVYEIKLQTNHF